MQCIRLTRQDRNPQSDIISDDDDDDDDDDHGDSVSGQVVVVNSVIRGRY